KAFIDFVLSEEGQNVVEDMGYIKLTGEMTPVPTPKVTPTPEVTFTSATTPAATPAAGAGATPTPPGFEAVFAIASMLAIAYATLRRRK
ncbi:MAG: hypothetical protein KAV25_01580, partial [Methanophagales archaeon]|nr:hypothetical protein [Methanophagales archaeon]